MPANWRKSFGPSYAVPALITRDPELEDISDVGDACPSFTVAAYAEAAGPRGEQLEDLRLAVEHPEPEYRTHDGSGRRYTVTVDGDTYYNYDDVTEAVADLKMLAAKLMGAPLPTVKLQCVIEIQAASIPAAIRMLDAFREAVLPSQEYGVTIYQAENAQHTIEAAK